MVRKKTKQTILITIILLNLAGFIPLVQNVEANPIVPRHLYGGIFQTGIYADNVSLYLKNASVTLDCYENHVEGYGKYLIGNLNSTTLKIPIAFSHFHLNASRFWVNPQFPIVQSIQSIKANNIELNFTCILNFWENITIDESCENMVVFNVTFDPLEIVTLEIEWDYTSKVDTSKYLLGYSIFAQGWNRSIEYEEVTFRFHTNDYYKRNEICVYSSDIPFWQFYDSYMMEQQNDTWYADRHENCNLSNYNIPHPWENDCTATEGVIDVLNEYSNRTSLVEASGYRSYQYSDSNISNDHFLIITNPFPDTRLRFIIGASAGCLIGAGIIATVVLFKKKKQANPR